MALHPARADRRKFRDSEIKKDVSECPPTARLLLI
jgi:hypothetical protein